ncbi:hypothetical protein AVEN_113775-1 [Araneus ventricosus]|uniref:Uncharacterized protein n=1 Tax=Araneus ventricosus TaxID=182803 RepID=A0A4Y2N8E4_ARAVE|nr:hypothetical protein AVEN_113775-1 [Araneus ventricosus]
MVDFNQQKEEWWNSKSAKEWQDFKSTKKKGVVRLTNQQKKRMVEFQINKKGNDGLKINNKEKGMLGIKIYKRREWWTSKSTKKGDGGLPNQQKEIVDFQINKEKGTVGARVTKENRLPNQQ